MSEEVKLYKLSQLGNLVNADHLDVLHMLDCMRMFEINRNPNTVPMYGQFTVSEHFRRTEKELFKKFFRDRNYFKDGEAKYELLITDAFIEYVKDRIEKVGEIYNVHFK